MVDKVDTQYAEAAGAPKRKRQKSTAPGSKDYWAHLPGWKSLEVGEDFLLGAEEGGFAGLEVLEDVKVLDSDYLASLNQAAEQQRAAEGANDAKGAKRKQNRAAGAGDGKEGEAAAPATAKGAKRKRAAEAAEAVLAASEPGDAAAALKARLKELDKERVALLKAAKRLKSAAGESPSSKGTTSAAGADIAAAAAADSGEAATEAGASGGSKRAAKAEARQARKKAALDKHKEQKRAAAEAKKGLKAGAAQQGQQQQQQQEELEGLPLGVDMSAWMQFGLHPLLLRALALQGFTHPTPIQEQALQPATRDRRDVIGAAQTGSGKTLAFGLPILQILLQERELEQSQQQLQQQEQQEGEQGEGQQEQQKQDKGSPLRALILAPTRELALQVSKHLQALGEVCRVRVVPIVGGLAQVKQQRALSKRPAIVVATPGRLWELMRDGEPHLTDLSALSFLVLDEADRMVQQGHFPELENILANLVQLGGAGPAPQRALQDMSKAQRETARERRLAMQKEDQRAARAAARQQQEEGQQAGEAHEGAGGDGDSGDGEEFGGSEGMDEGELAVSEEGEGESEQEEVGAADSQEEGPAGDQEEQEGGRELVAASGAGEQQEAGPSGRGLDADDDVFGGGSSKAGSGRRRLLQTFVFSATLTLPAALRKRLRKGGGGSSGSAMLERLMDCISFRGKPTIVDLTPQRKLADRIEEATLECLDSERDALLYYLLARHPGRTLVFVNAVSATRRLVALLQLLGLPAKALHAQQQQRQRLKALDAFKAIEQAVLVATDVAARGLDVRNVACVVHYQMPAAADTYIHRCGRTGRVGSSEGLSVCLVAPGEAPRFAALCRALNRPPPPAFPVDKRVVHQAHLRVALALKIDALQRTDRKQRAGKSWLVANAAAAGVDLSDGEGASSSGDERGRGAAAKGGAALSAKDRVALDRMKAELAEMLAAPLQQSINARFFTGGAGAAAAAASTRQAGAGAVADAEGNAGDEDAAAAASEAAAEAVANTVQLAARLQQSRAAAAQTQKHGKAAPAAATKQQGKRANKQQRKQPGKPDFAKLMVSRNEMKRRQKGGLVVVGGGTAFGRDVQAPSALAALRGSRGA